MALGYDGGNLHPTRVTGMAGKLLDYNLLVENALRGAVRDALKRAAEFGLPGNHHFYVTFRTDQPGVEIPAYLRERYPDEMTIVLQHQFWGLEPGEDKFQVTLSFNKVPERLVVPYAALTAFADPSVQFGLQFRVQPSAESLARGAALAAEAPATEPSADDKPAEEPKPTTGEVVALDAFRKKKT
ncbi:ClpXP protease specificity-enhancing factor SspB [Ferrovibrio sp. MS7]|uniref:SspB family protein n=1 Tax=Ferrovibrio plantarum TaxID=3119164 RepID=UPI003135C1CF